MKRISIIFLFLFLLFGICTPIHAEEIKGNFSDIVTKGPWIDSRAYASLAEADAAAVAADKPLLIAQDYTLGANTVLASHISFSKGCVITTTGYTLTFTGRLEAGPYQIFSGSGTVTGLTEAYPEWWGTGDDTIQKAVTAVTYGKVHLTKTYTTTTTITGKVGVMISGIRPEGSNPDITITANHTGDIVTFTDTAYENGGIENVSLIAGSGYEYNGAGIRVTVSAGTPSNGYVRGVHIYHTAEGLHLTGAVYWQFEDLQIKNVDYGIHLDGTTTNNFNQFKNVIVNADHGVGYGLYITGAGNLNVFNNVDLSSCLEAFVHTGTEGINNVINGLWLESNTANIRMDSTNGGITLRDVTNASGVDLINSSSTNPQNVFVEGYYSATGLGAQSLGKSVGDISFYPSPLYAVNSEGFKARKTSKFIANDTGVFSALIPLSMATPWGGFGKPLANKIGTTIDSWASGTGAVVTGQTDPWGGTTFYSLNGNKYDTFAMGTTVASKKMVFTGYIKGTGNTATIRIQGSSTLLDDVIYLPTDDWYLFRVVRDIPSTDTGTDMLVAVTTDAVTYLGRLSLYIGDGLAIPTPEASDYSGLKTVMSLGADIFGGVEMLLSTTTVSFAADGDTTLFTVPTGRRCVLTKAIIVAAADAGSTDITIGQNGAETDFVGTTQMDNLNSQYDAVIVQPIMNATPVIGKSYEEGTVIQINVANHAGAAGNTVYLYGHLHY